MINHPTRFVLLLVSIAFAGCARTFAPVNSTMQGATRQYEIPPKELLKTIREVVSAPPLSLGVTDEQGGSIVTGYQSFPGEFRVARRWQERTRYRINVTPDFDRPTEAARVEVREYTEQRAAEGMKWEASAELERNDRARELLLKIDEQVRQRSGPGGGSTTTSPTR